MMANNTCVASLLATSSLVSGTMLSSEQVLNQPFASLTPSLVRRQDDGTDTVNATDQSLLNADGTLNITAWEAATDYACEETLSSLTRASNPSGMSVCYNLASLDTNNGSFEAMLKLYMVSEMRDDWVGVNTSEVDIGLSFEKADVDEVQEESFQGVGMLGNVAKRQDDGEEEEEDNPDLPALMQSYMIIGMIREEHMEEGLSMAELEMRLMPDMSLSAPRPNDPNRNLTTTLSPNEASFLTGVFSDMTPQSDFAAAQGAVDRQIKRLEDREIAFVLPGTQIMIFPIGLIITGTWAVLGFAAYGFGTWERWQHREMYRQRKGMMQSGVKAPYGI